MPTESSSPRHFLIVDGIRGSSFIALAKSLDSQWENLYLDIEDNMFEDVAPHIVLLHAGSPLLAHLEDEIWGKSNAILWETHESARDFSARIRQFIRVENEQGEKFFFRFFDPRILRFFLPSATPDQGNVFLARDCRILAESLDGAVWFGWHSKNLTQQELHGQSENWGLPEPYSENQEADVLYFMELRDREKKRVPVLKEKPPKEEKAESKWGKWLKI